MIKKHTAAAGPLLAPIRKELTAAEQDARRNIAHTELEARKRYAANEPAKLRPISGPLFGEPNKQATLF